jgi:hypothetical protein
MSMRSLRVNQLNLLSAPNGKCDALLEIVVEVICLPIIDVVGELRTSLIVITPKSGSYSL